MSESEEYHNQAMECVDRALIAGRNNNKAEEQAMFAEAYYLERSAAMMYVNRPEREPTRSVLFRSAAALAHDAGLMREAEQMVAFGLAGDPPTAIAEELRDLLAVINFSRHLELRGIELLPNQIQLSFWEGDYVGFGIIKADSFVQRLERISKVAARTIARKKGLPFEEHSALPKDLRGSLETYISAPRAQSFAFTLLIGAAPQLGLFGADSTVAIVEEVVACFDLYNRGAIDELRERIPDEAYFRNFVAQAKEIAPDGKHVRGVGLTSLKGGIVQSIRLNLRSELSPVPPRPDKHSSEEVGEIVVVKGELRGAHSIRSSTIEVVPDHGKNIKILVPRGMMSDIVKPLWEEHVVADVRKVENGFELIQIRAWEEREES